MWRVLDLVAFCDLDELSRFAGTPAPLMNLMEELKI